nr:DUF4279 domain-containing protein [Litoreibacter halocynthiae]
MRIWGDDLIPEDVSSLLGQPPTKSESKGDVLIGKVTGQKRNAKTGGWRLAAPDQLDGNLDAQVVGLFRMLTSDSAIWNELNAKFELDIFCGVFMKTGNDGLSLRPATLELLGMRGIGIEIDIYDHSED